MNLSLLKYFSYIIILSSTFLAYSMNDNQCYNLFQKPYLDKDEESEDFFKKQESLANEFRDLITKTTSTQKELNEALKKDTDKKILLNMFVALQFPTEPLQKDENSLETEFMQIYTNDRSFRDWFHELQILYLFEHKPHNISKAKMDELERIFKQNTQLPWKKFSEAYNKDTSFQKLATNFQEFILQSLEAKKRT